MSTNPQLQSTVTPERIFGALNAFQLSKALVGAIELDLFTAIGEGKKDVAQLAPACGAAERGIRILCDFLTVHGLLTKTDGGWELAPDSAVFLNRKSPAFLGDAALFLNAPEMLDAYRDVAATVRRGGTLLDGEGTVSPDNPIWVQFARSMAPMMQGAAIDIAEILDGRAPSKVLDVAAGHGLFGIHLAKRNPKARITALDWARVLEVAMENAADAGVADRIHPLAGSVFDATLESDYDVALLTNFLHHFDRPTCVGLLKKIRGSLKPGGVAVTLEFIPDDNRVTPPIHAGFALIMLASTRAGDAYTFREFESMFAEAGFVSSELRELQRSPQRVIISQR